MAVEETEDEWLKLAETGTLRKIERAVNQAKRGEHPPKDAYGICRTRVTVKVDMPIEDYAVFNAAVERLAESAGMALNFEGALYLLAKAYLEKPVEQQEKDARKAFQVVYHRCPDCDRAWIVTCSTYVCARIRRRGNPFEEGGGEGGRG